MVGQRLGHYRVLEKIGAGGMGVVYRAHDERLERDVALKVLPAGILADEAARRRFRKEALALSQLNHPNIATVHDFDTQEQTDFLVMEYIPGVTLSEKLAAGALAEKEITRLGLQLAQGLAAAHEHAVVHRDLKPGNLRITPDGWLKILDFGLATLRRPEVDGAATATMSDTAPLAGTLPYMAPEQLRGEKADSRSDIYAAGVVLYEMSTGRRPFAETSGAQLVAAILQQAPPAPSAVNKRVSPALDSIVLKALDKERERRYQSARELAVDLERMSAAATAPAPARRNRWPLAAAATLVLLLAAAVYVFSGRGKAIESVAILPFVNASGSAEAEYLSDGISETLINSLSQLPGLKVMSRSSVFRYKGREADPLAVGRDLKVRAVLLGRLVQRGESLSISAELVDAGDGRHLWGEQYSRKLADLLAIQEQLGREIAEQLRPRLTGEQKKQLAQRQPQNREAYQEYLQGRYFWSKTTAAGLQTAIEHFQKAIAKDPAYALAYQGLAQCYAGISFFSALPPREAFPKAQAAASKALQIDETLADPHTTLAFYNMIYDWDWAGAEREFRKALQLDPSYATGHQMYSYYLETVGRFEEAIQEAKRAQELDPVSLTIATALGIAYEHARRYDQATEQYRKVLAMDPNFVRARLGLGVVYILKSMHIEAIAETQTAVNLAPAEPPAVSYLGLAYARSGDRVAARKVLESIMAERSRRGYFLASWIAVVHLGLGDNDRAFEWLGKAVEEHDPWLIYIKRPLWDLLRSDPRYPDLLRGMNLAP